MKKLGLSSDDPLFPLDRPNSTKAHSCHSLSPRLSAGEAQ